MPIRSSRKSGESKPKKQESTPGPIRRFLSWISLFSLETALGAPVLAAITAFLQHAALYFSWIKQPYWAYIELHPWRVMASALVLGVVVSSVFKLSRKFRHISIGYRTFKQVAHSFGIESFWEGGAGEQQESAWKYCQKAIGDYPSDLRLLGASGWETFGSPDSPLHETVCNHRGTIYVMLMHPKSPHLEERAESLNTSIEGYTNEISSTILFLKDLKKNGNREIELRLYLQPPIWKMIVTGNFLWLQYYQQGTHVSDMPVYGFASSSPHSLYHPLLQVFNKRWSRDGDQTVLIDLENFTSIEALS